VKRSGRLPRHTRLAPGGKPRPRNPRRHATNWARAFGSTARVEWVKTLTCLVAHTGTCGGLIENAHVGTGGMGRKADASAVVPLCHWHHYVLHRNGVRSFERYFGVRLVEAAAAVQRAWRAYQERSEEQS
jgi:hypothetical protein